MPSISAATNQLLDKTNMTNQYRGGAGAPEFRLNLKL